MAEFSGWNIVSERFFEQQISKIKPIEIEVKIIVYTLPSLLSTFVALRHCRTVSLSIFF